jgi:Rieske Fe-S protein
MSERRRADSADLVPAHRLTRRGLMSGGAGLLVAGCGGGAPSWETKSVESRDGVVELEYADHPELVTAGGMLAVRPAGMKKPVLVMRLEHDQVRVLSLECPHMGCVVRWDNDEQLLRCPCHGSRFDDTGRALDGPAKTSLRELDSEARGTRVAFRVPK